MSNVNKSSGLKNNTSHNQYLLTVSRSFPLTTLKLLYTCLVFYFLRHNKQQKTSNSPVYDVEISNFLFCFIYCKLCFRHRSGAAPFHYVGGTQVNSHIEDLEESQGQPWCQVDPGAAERCGSVACFSGEKFTEASMNEVKLVTGRGQLGVMVMGDFWMFLGGGLPCWSHFADVRNIRSILLKVQRMLKNYLRRLVSHL